MCVGEWVQPCSLGSSEKTLWYSARRDLAASANSGGHDSSLIRSNSSNNFSCHCFMVNLGIWWPWPPSDMPPSNWICTGTSGIQVNVTALATGVFFLRVWGICVTVPYYYSNIFYCYLLTPYKHSAPSGPGVRICLQYAEPESSHWSLLPGVLSSPLYVWLRRRRHLWCLPLW